MTEINGSSPSFVRQRTLKHAIHCSGTGRHSGAKVAMTLRPAAPNSGVVFHRSDLGEAARLAATWENAADLGHGITLGRRGGPSVAAVEHLLSALCGCGIDNAVVELNGPEIPAMDGSTAAFVFLLECAGACEQEAPRRALVVQRRVDLFAPRGSLSLSPGAGFCVHVEADARGLPAEQRAWFVAVEAGSYKREVCRAREPGPAPAGATELGGGGGRLVRLDGPKLAKLDAQGESRLRYPNEALRHKALDMIGALYLCGGPIIGCASALGGGETLVLPLLQKLFAETDAWRWSPLPVSRPPDRAAPVHAAGEEIAAARR